MALYYSISESPIKFSALQQNVDETTVLHIKLAAVGDTSTGKTGLLKTVADNHSIEDFYLTSVDNFRISFEGAKHSGILEMHDMPSLLSPDHQTLGIHDVDVFLLCFAIDSPISFQHLEEQLVAEIRKRIKKEHIPMILVGLKSDIRDQQQVDSAKLISVDKAIQFAKEIKAAAYIESSSLTGSNVHHVVEIAVNAALKQRFRKKCIVM